MNDPQPSPTFEDGDDALDVNLREDLRDRLAYLETLSRDEVLKLLEARFIADHPDWARIAQQSAPARSRTLTEMGEDSNRSEERTPQREGTPISLGFIDIRVCPEHAGTYLMPHGTPEAITLWAKGDDHFDTHTHVHTSIHRTVGTITFGAWQTYDLGRTAFTDWSSTGTRPAAWHELGPAS